MAANSDERNRPDDDPVYDAWRSVGENANVGQDVNDAPVSTDEHTSNNAPTSGEVVGNDLKESPPERATASLGVDGSNFELADAVHRNTELLQQLIERLESQVPEAAAVDHTADDQVFRRDTDPFAVASDDAIEAVDENIRLREEADQLREEIRRLQQEIDELRAENNELSAESAAPTGETGRGGQETEPAPEMDWEERKRQILAELENDSFDAESFLTTMNEDIASGNGIVGGFESPAEYVEALNAELKNLSQRLQTQEKENQDLITRLESASAQASEVSQSLEDIPVDEQVQQERDKLARMEADWQERFREAEIEASMERAKMSRERRMMELKNQALEEQVEALKVYEKDLANSQSKETGGARRKWMAKLGISEDE